MLLVIGCPVRQRAWILPHWFAAIEQAVANAGIENALYAFVRGADDMTMVDVHDAAVRDYGRVVGWITVDEEPRADVREWHEARYTHMAFLRNELLAGVREIGPDLFWSVDSDILVHPDSLRLALEGLDRFDAVGSRTYLSERGTECPNWGVWSPSNGLHRVDAEGFFPVGLLMAIKLMTPSAYFVDYQPHHCGEDFGWSLAAKGAGVRLGWDGRVASKHVMVPEQLELVDARCGY